MKDVHYGLSPVLYVQIYYNTGRLHTVRIHSIFINYNLDNVFVLLETQDSFYSTICRYLFALTFPSIYKRYFSSWSYRFDEQ